MGFWGRETDREMREGEKRVNDWACLGNLKVHPQGCALSNKASPPNYPNCFRVPIPLMTKHLKIWSYGNLRIEATTHAIRSLSHPLKTHSHQGTSRLSSISIPFIFFFPFAAYEFPTLIAYSSFHLSSLILFLMCSKESVRNAFRLCIPCNVFSWLKFRTLLYVLMICLKWPFTLYSNSNDGLKNFNLADNDMMELILLPKARNKV